uniref:Transposase n=1 Tax=Steinernema glaseri TaxID=37863 RepID=A0A1I7ZPZ2_9BILA
MSWRQSYPDSLCVRKPKTTFSRHLTITGNKQYHAVIYYEHPTKHDWLQVLNALLNSVLKDIAKRKAKKP